ncbi:hypothetical protein VFPPC_16659 [Pochonia chlamydosporia 170]|uniref:Uncharacterized protein n=1 Tax=Pochonia chlamydosporia 170 TaxID=1380566 RepID=A0A179FAH7_METCM|nr:hypothetical protein VFPPC_16659 [Pochonia chlamydosporia 170]OAQ62462.1 hypothetical protein VFPPC_16659 [Pochonia chlamydosporia 170]
MASSTTTEIPVFLPYTPGVLSIIGLINILFGLMVAGITGKLLNILLVPIVVSAACALGNGLGYYIYTDYAALNRAIASPFADLSWLIQEAGLNFYGYIILTYIVRGRERVIFMTLFWALMVILACFRVAILVVRIHFILDNNSPALELTLGYLHVAYFITIALIECVSAVFLLRTFRMALRSSEFLSSDASHLHYLVRSTEVRLSTLALIGIMRAVVFPLQFVFTEEGLAGQLDHFASILESLFPVVMFIDILGSRRLFASNNCTGSNSFTHRRPPTSTSTISYIATPRVVRSIKVSSGGKPSNAITDTDIASKGASGRIRKTTEFKVHEGSSECQCRKDWS